MLQSDWSIGTCLLRDLQTLLVILEGFLELAERVERVSNVAVRHALARLVACTKSKIENFQRTENAAL